MKVITKNVVFSILKVGIVTALLATLMLMGVDLFKNLDKYTDYRLTADVVLSQTLLYAPEAFLLGLGPAFLFSVSYYLSMLHASNEIICILNSGMRYRKIIVPCIMTAIGVSCFYFGFNELVAINCSNKKESVMQIITMSDNGQKDNSEVALSDMQNGYMVYAGKYINATKSLFDITLIEKDLETNEVVRTDAYKAQWNKDKENWTLYDSYVYRPAPDGLSSDITYYDEITDSILVLEPELFRNLSAEVSKMDLKLAGDYVQKMKHLNPDQYASLATEFYERLLGFLTPLVMIIIACSMNYRFKKNVLFFSIISSLCVAVVYYVVKMMTTMLADQGVIRPYFGVLMPFIIILILAGGASLLMRE